MVPRTSRPGRGFKGAWNYYAHDKRTPEQKAQGQEVRSRERERGNMAWEFQRLARQQEAERAALEKKIEEAQKIGSWREGGPERTAQQQRPEPGEQQEYGRGGRTRER